MIAVKQIISNTFEESFKSIVQAIWDRPDYITDSRIGDMRETQGLTYLVLDPTTFEFENKLNDIAKSIHKKRALAIPLFTKQLEKNLKNLEMKNTRICINLNQGKELYLALKRE